MLFKKFVCISVRGELSFYKDFFGIVDLYNQLCRSRSIFLTIGGFYGCFSDKAKWFSLIWLTYLIHYTYLQYLSCYMYGSSGYISTKTDPNALRKIGKLQ